MKTDNARALGAAARVGLAAVAKEVLEKPVMAVHPEQPRDRSRAQHHAGHGQPADRSSADMNGAIPLRHGCGLLLHRGQRRRRRHVRDQSRHHRRHQDVSLLDTNCPPDASWRTTTTAVTATTRSPSTTRPRRRQLLDHGRRLQHFVYRHPTSSTWPSPRTSAAAAAGQRRLRGRHRPAELRHQRLHGRPLRRLHQQLRRGRLPPAAPATPPSATTPPTRSTWHAGENFTASMVSAHDSAIWLVTDCAAAAATCVAGADETIPTASRPSATAPPPPAGTT